MCQKPDRDRDRPTLIARERARERGEMDEEEEKDFSRRKQFPSREEREMQKKITRERERKDLPPLFI